MTPDDYIAALEEPRRADVRRVHDLIRETLPDLEPNVDGGMLGYGRYHYRYASGRVDLGVLRELLAEAGAIGPAAAA